MTEFGDPTILRGLMLDRNLRLQGSIWRKTLPIPVSSSWGIFFLSNQTRSPVCAIIGSLTTVEIPVFSERLDEFWLDGVGESAENLRRCTAVYYGVQLGKDPLVDPANEKPIA